MNWEAALSAVGVGLAIIGYLSAFGTTFALSFAIDRPGLRWLFVPAFALIGVFGTGMAAGLA